MKNLLKKSRIKKLSPWSILLIQMEDRLETWLAGLFLHSYMGRINKTGDDYSISHSGNGSSTPIEREIMKQGYQSPATSPQSQTYSMPLRPSEHMKTIINLPPTLLSYGLAVTHWPCVRAWVNCDYEYRSDEQSNEENLKILLRSANYERQSAGEESLNSKKTFLIYHLRHSFFLFPLLWHFDIRHSNVRYSIILKLRLL